MNLNLRLLSSVKELGKKAWSVVEDPDFPFYDYEFLSALETSGSVGEKSGWQTLILVCEAPCEGGGSHSGESSLKGALVSFVKNHSYGEYIFDWQWARFFQANGVDYYPKLVTAVPFTPATGPKILLAKDVDRKRVASLLVQSALDIAKKSKMSSFHALFIAEDERDVFASEGLGIRHSLQYHWKDEGYKGFEDFLSRLVAKRRRDIQRERRRANSHGLDIRVLTGKELTKDHADLMIRFYHSTTEKKEAIAYLQPSFFEEIFETMSDRIAFAIAYKENSGVAGALNFFKGQKLYGRYWGAEAHYSDLHFELCYYRMIEFALARGLRIFEAGAQGEHKVQRGFLPSYTYSAHKIFDPRFERPIGNFLEDERKALYELVLSYSSPFQSLPGNV